MIKQLNSEGGTKIDIEDIGYVYLIHKPYQNGLVLKCVVKKELHSFQSEYHKERDKYGFVRRKYDNITGTYYIRNKDEPKLRNKIYKLIEKHGKIHQKTTGINAGTPIAQSWTITDKRLTGEQLKQLLIGD